MDISSTGQLGEQIDILVLGNEQTWILHGCLSTRDYLSVQLDSSMKDARKWIGNDVLMLRRASGMSLMSSGVVRIHMKAQLPLLSHNITHRTLCLKMVGITAQRAVHGEELPRGRPLGRSQILFVHFRRCPPPETKKEHQTKRQICSA